MEGEEATVRVITNRILHSPGSFAKISRCDPSGEKLSKQTPAPALDDGQASQSLWKALAFLGYRAQAGAPVHELLDWGIGNWLAPAGV